MTVRESKSACPPKAEDLRALQSTVAGILETVRRDGDKALGSCQEV